MAVSARQRQRWLRYWNRHSRGYDRQMGLLDRVLFGDTRHWVCSQAGGRVLEVAVGSGLNLEHYPQDVALTGVDLSPAMLARARSRAGALGRVVDLRVADAEALDFPDGSFDTVVCTFSLCAIPDHRRAVAAMVRVLRPGGMLLLADHVVAAHPALRAVQRVVELVSVPLGGEHFQRRPLELVAAAGLRIERHDRLPPVSSSGSPRGFPSRRRRDGAAALAGPGVLVRRLRRPAPAPDGHRPGGTPRPKHSGRSRHGGT